MNRESILVNRAWLEELLANAIKVDDAIQEFDYTDKANHKFVSKVAILVGYAKSSQYILNRPTP